MQNSVTFCSKQVDPNLYYETTHSSLLSKLRSNKVITCIKEYYLCDERRDCYVIYVLTQ